MYQEVNIIGHVGKDPESRFLPSGTQVTNFSVATTEKWTNNDGQRQEATIWWRCTAFDKRAALIAEYVHRGSKIHVVGKMSPPNAWIDREGKPQASLEMKVGQITFLSTKGETGADAGAAAAPQQDNIEEELPF